MGSIVLLIVLLMWTVVFIFFAGRPDNPFMRRRGGQVVHIIDGKTIRINPIRQRVVLWGIDAPERGADGFMNAKRALYDLAYGQHVTCLEVEVDLDQRVIARCYLQDGTEINRLMIDSGTVDECTDRTKKSDIQIE